MLGTILNVFGILIGGAVGLSRRKPLNAAQEAWFKVALAAFIVYYGLRLTWLSFGGSWVQLVKQFVILLLALTLGRLTGRFLRLQKMSNRLGQRAREAIASVSSDDPLRFSRGFNTCAALFCAAPLGIVGAIQDGLSLSIYFYPLAVKAVIDGLATMGFVRLFGGGVLLSAFPVFAVQGTITLVSAYFLKPVLETYHLVESVNAVSGILIFCVALVMLELKRVEITDYLPSLIFAPLLTHVLR